MTERGRVEHLKPEQLPGNPAFTNVVAVSGPVLMRFSDDLVDWFRARRSGEPAHGSA
jgi:hypothetical protein